MAIYYHLLFISVLFFIIGFISGFILLIRKFYMKNEIQENIKRTEYVTEYTHEEDVSVQEIEKALSARKDEGNFPDRQNMFRERIVNTKHSFTDTLDEDTKKAYIEQNRGKQDSAYNYIGNSTDKHGENT